MTRESMVEKAARALAGLHYAEEWDLSARVEAMEDARAVIDAILPQVTTGEELEALPVGTILLGDSGEMFVKTRRGTLVEVLENASGMHWLLEEIDFTLTVVWRPEP